MTHHTKPAATRTISVKVNTFFSLLAVTVCAVALAPSQAEAAAPDPFTGDVWHAMSPTWPGTVTFDGKTKKVTLSPLAAPAIVASYAYTLEQKAPSKDAKQVVRGTLTMTSTKGEVSKSNFRIEDRRNLVLEFKEGQRSEQYVRMSPKEETAERARIQKLFNEGKLKLAP